MLHPKTDEHVNPSVAVHHPVGKLSTAETLLTEVQRKVTTGFLVINVCNQGKTLCSPCILSCINPWETTEHMKAKSEVMTVKLNQ